MATERAWWAVLLLIIYALIVCSGLIVAAISHPGTGNGFVYELGRSFALIGIGIIAMQFVLSARLHWAERPFGLDMMLRYHKAMAVLAFVLLLMHPVLLALGGAGWQLLTNLHKPWNIWFGRAALLLLLLQVTLSGFRQPLRLGFERWRLLHNQAALIIGLAAVHGRVTGEDFTTFRSMQILWLVLVAIVVIAYAYHKLVRPLSLARHAYRVTGVRQETHNVWTIAMEPPAGRKRFAFRPGQFHFIHLRRGRGLPGEEHHFTISSSPTGDTLTSTIKESGDFTRTISPTRPGDVVAVLGPYGRFSCTYRGGDKDLVFIVGGIGITPIMSMLRDMRDTAADANALLIDCNHTEGDIVFREELDQIAAGTRPKLRVVHVLTRPSGSWNGESNHIDREKLARLMGTDDAKRMYYVCGPGPMMRNVFAALRELGVPPSRIDYERFAL
jgi:predicted ferric reductase